MSPVAIQPSKVTVMIKPVGALCNLDCGYCYYLPTKSMYDGHEHRMKLEVLEDIFAGVLPQFADEVTIAWQGGEPTLAGIPFFEKAIEFQEKYRRPSQRVSHALQTNGTLLTDDWCKFLKKQNFLVGLSIDGPPQFHDHYRLTNRQVGSSKLVMQGLKLLQKHAVDYNMLCVLNDHNVHHPDEVMRFLLNLGSRWLQFIPAIEWVPDPENPGRNKLAPFSPDPEAVGEFLCRVFDLWFDKYRKRVSIRRIDAALNKLVLGNMPFCILDGACHSQMTIEHDGAVFGCDHFVERRWQLAQIGNPNWRNSFNTDGTENVGLTVHGGGYEKAADHEGRDIESQADFDQRFAPERAASDAGDRPFDGGWLDRVEDDRLATFAARKQNLPEDCRTCKFKPFCYGGCPKHRPHGGGEPEKSVLCPAYMRFYEHSMERLEWLASFIRQNRPPPDPQGDVERKKGSSRPSTAGPATGKTRIARNAPCPCGSGLKYKRCHGKHL